MWVMSDSSTYRCNNFKFSILVATLNDPILIYDSIFSDY